MIKLIKNKTKELLGLPIMVDLAIEDVVITTSEFVEYRVVEELEDGTGFVVYTESGVVYLGNYEGFMFNTDDILTTTIRHKEIRSVVVAPKSNKTQYLSARIAKHIAEYNEEPQKLTFCPSRYSIQDTYEERWAMLSAKLHALGIVPTRAEDDGYEMIVPHNLVEEVTTLIRIHR